jgi:hypothetical protein
MFESARPLLRTSLVTKKGKGSAGWLGPSKPLSTFSSQHLNIWLQMSSGAENRCFLWKAYKVAKKSPVDKC